jgi:sialate O-acetylesterase
VPASWEDEGFNGYNGYAWYRKSFEGSSLSTTNGSFNLFVGYIDDVDEVYFNGHRIGASGSFPPRYHTAYNAMRRYFIPKEYINFQGRNVVAVRVYDAEIEGGIVSGDVGIFVDDNEQQFLINLRGMWDFSLLYRRAGHVSPDRFSKSSNRRPPEDATWTRLNVPGLWEHQGYNNYDGTAWYRKQFYVPKELQGEDLILILGKIDDNDETYLNGKLVGSTYQHDRIRVYPISSQYLIPGSINLILIYVDDTGGEGGIYEGPVGLMKQSEFTRFMRWRDE